MDALSAVTTPIASVVIDLDKRHEALAVSAARLFDAQAPAAQHHQPHTQNLPRAQMSMRDLRLPQQLLERVHASS